MKKLAALLLAPLLWLSADAFAAGEVIEDDFSDSVGTELDGRTPIPTDAGDNWNVIVGCALNECQIGAQNDLDIAGAFNEIVIDSGLTSNRQINYTWTNVDRELGIVLRTGATGTTNGDGFRAVIDENDANEVQLFKCTTGSCSLVDSASDDTITDNDVLRVDDDGENITIYINDVDTGVTTADTDYASNSYVGLYEGAGNGVDSIDDFQVRALGGGGGGGGSDQTLPAYSLDRDAAVPAVANNANDQVTLDVTTTTLDTGELVQICGWNNESFWMSESGIYDASTDTYDSNFLAHIDDMDNCTLRFPGGLISAKFVWEASVGPQGSRTSQRRWTYDHADRAEYGLKEWCELTDTYNLKRIYVLNLVGRAFGEDDSTVLAFTSGGPTTIAVGDVIDDDDNGGSGTVFDVAVTSGSFGAGTAAGYLHLKNQTGSFDSGEIDISGGSSNVATIAGNSTVTNLRSDGEGFCDKSGSTCTYSGALVDEGRAHEESVSDVATSIGNLGQWMIDNDCVPDYFQSTNEMDRRNWEYGSEEIGDRLSAAVTALDALTWPNGDTMPRVVGFTREYDWPHDADASEFDTWGDFGLREATLNTNDQAITDNRWYRNTADAGESNVTSLAYHCQDGMTCTLTDVCMEGSNTSGSVTGNLSVRIYEDDDNDGTLENYIQTEVIEIPPSTTDQTLCETLTPALTLNQGSDYELVFGRTSAGGGTVRVGQFAATGNAYERADDDATPSEPFDADAGTVSNVAWAVYFTVSATSEFEELIRVLMESSATDCTVHRYVNAWDDGTYDDTDISRSVPGWLFENGPGSVLDECQSYSGTARLLVTEYARIYDFNKAYNNAALNVPLSDIQSALSAVDMLLALQLSMVSVATQHVSISNSWEPFDYDLDGGANDLSEMPTATAPRLLHSMNEVCPLPVVSTALSPEDNEAHGLASGSVGSINAYETRGVGYRNDAGDKLCVAVVNFNTTNTPYDIIVSELADETVDVVHSYIAGEVGMDRDTATDIDDYTKTIVENPSATTCVFNGSGQCTITMPAMSFNTLVFDLDSGSADSTAPTCSVAPAVEGDTGPTSVMVSVTCSDETDTVVSNYVMGIPNGDTAPTASEIRTDTYGGTTECRVVDSAIDNGDESRMICDGPLDMNTDYDFYVTSCDTGPNCSTPVKVDAKTQLAISRLYAADFDAANDTAIAAYDEDFAWQTMALANAASVNDSTAGACTIQGNELSCPQDTVAEGDIGTPNMMVKGEASNATPTNRYALQIRRTDKDNNISCLCRPASNFCSIVKFEGGTETALASQPFLTFTNPSELWCGVEDDVISLWLNPVDGSAPTLVVENAFNNTATKFAVGTWRNSGTQLWNDVRVAKTFAMQNRDQGVTSQGTKSLFSEVSDAIDSVSYFWENWDDNIDNTPNEYYLREGGDVDIDPDTDFSGTHSVGFYMFRANSNRLDNLTYNYITGETSPSVAPTFDDACVLADGEYVLGETPSVVNIATCLDTPLPQPQPTYTLQAGTITPNRTVNSDGTLTGTVTDNAGSPYSFTIRATNAGGFDDFVRTETITVPTSDGGPQYIKDPQVYYRNIGDTFNFNITEYCSDATDYNVSNLHSGLTLNSATISGTFDTDYINGRTATVTCSNNEGSVDVRLTIFVGESENSLRRAMKPALKPALKSPFGELHK